MNDTLSPDAGPAARVRFGKRQWAGLAFMAAVIAMAVAYSLWYWEREQPPQLMVGQRVDFALPALHDPNDTVRAADLRGNAYLISFWASWCGFCTREHPAVLRLSQMYGVKVLGFNYMDEREDALRWLREHGDGYWKIAVDADGAAAQAMKVYATPQHILVGPDGVVLWKWNGVMSDQVFRTRVEPLLRKVQGAVTAPTQTSPAATAPAEPSSTAPGAGADA